MLCVLGRRDFLRGALAAAGATLLPGCGARRQPAVRVALAAVPGNGYIQYLLTIAIETAAQEASSRVDLSLDADWRAWVAHGDAALPDLVLTGASGIVPPLSGRLQDLSPILQAVRATGDLLPAERWRPSGHQAALPVLCDPLVLLTVPDFPADTQGQGFPFLGSGWLENSGAKVPPWDWNALVEAVAADQTRHSGYSGIDLGLPDTGPTLALWLARGFNSPLAEAAPSTWRASFADGLAVPDLTPEQVPTLPTHGPHTGMSALLALLWLAPPPGRQPLRPRIRFTHASTAAGGGGLDAGRTLTPASGYRLLPLPVLPAGPVVGARFLTVSVSRTAPPQALALVRQLLRPETQADLARSGWGVPATAKGFLEWAVAPYRCTFTGGLLSYHWVCAPLPLTTAELTISPQEVFGARTAANAAAYDLVQRDLLAALASLPGTDPAGAAAILRAAAAAANDGQTFAAPGRSAPVPPGVVFPGF